MIAPTTDLPTASEREWDCIVIGAGPAGSTAALGIARSGRRVLLVDRSHFPRHKLCGACVNGETLARLYGLGLAERLSKLGGIPLKEFQLGSSHRSVSLQLPGGMAIPRSQFDAMLVESAIDAGADFLPGVSLEVEATDSAMQFRRLTPVQLSDCSPLMARSVVVATGLPADRRTSDSALKVVANRNSRIGAGTSTSVFPDAYTSGTIFMAVGKSGYVGLTRTEGDELNIAAALDRSAVQQASPRGVCENILNEAGFPVSDSMFSGDWSGTIGLTRHRKASASTRLFVIGDAGGYVEPFTGEGMAWAVRGALAVGPFVERAIDNWTPSLVDEWSRFSTRLIGQRQRLCRILSRLLRHPFLVRNAVRVVALMPFLGQAVISQLNKDCVHELLDPWNRHSSTA